jgi:GNAT superfamily N-acetyltransferase
VSDDSDGDGSDSPAVSVRYGRYEGDVDDLLGLYRSYDWWADRDREAVRAALDGTDEVVALVATTEDYSDTAPETRVDGPNGRLVAAGRVLTDYVYYATVYDVIVAPDRRGEGLGQRLLAAIVDHPALTDTPGVSLLCREGLVDFYRECGFELGDEAIDHPDGAPERLRRMVYRREDGA